MKCPIFHTVESCISLGRILATLMLLACTIGAHAEDLLDVIQTKNVTVSRNEDKRLLVASCNHRGDTSEPTSHVDATCEHGSYDEHVCSECGAQYNTPQANDKKDHVDADQDHYCDVCYNYIHPDADKDGQCDNDGCGQVALETIVKTYNVTLDGYSHCDGMIPANYGLMSGPVQYYYDEVDPENSQNLSYGSLSLEFYSETTCFLSFDFVASVASEDCYLNISSSIDRRGINYSYSNIPQTFSQEFSGGRRYSLTVSYSIYDSDVDLRIYNIRIIACDHSDDTGEAIQHVEATCTHGSYDIYTCSICGCEYNSPEANDKVKHTDADDDCNCDVCGAAMLEKIFEVSDGIEMSFEPLVYRVEPWRHNIYDVPKLSISLHPIERFTNFGYSLVTITSPKDFTLSFDYSCDASVSDERYEFEYRSTDFSATLLDENGKDTWNSKIVDFIEEWSAQQDSSSATIDLPAGTYYLFLSAHNKANIVSCYASVYNLKALYIESAIEKKSHDYQRFIMNHADLGTDDSGTEDSDSEDSGIEDLNEDGKISVGDITIAIDRALKDEESGE